MENDLNINNEKIEIYFSCRNLIRLGFFTKLDSQIILYEIKNNKNIKIGKTEIVYDNLNPDFTSTFIINFNFQIRQKYCAEIIDDEGNNKVNKLGEVKFYLSDIINQNDLQIIKIIENENKEMGSLIIKLVKLEKKVNHEIKFNISLSGFTNHGCFGNKNSCLFKILKNRNNKDLETVNNMNITTKNKIEYLLVYQSEYILENNNPKFKTVSISSSKLNYANDKIINKIEVYKYLKKGKEELIGYCFFKIEDFKNNNLIFLEVKNNRKNRICNLSIEKFEKNEKYEFLDYLSNGLNINLIIAIDFSASNIDQNEKNSNHFINKDDKNIFLEAINKVGEFLIQYDTDRLVPLYGFGSKLKFENYKTKKCSHFFPINGNIENPYIEGLDNLNKVYKDSLKYLQFSGPTYLSPLLENINKMSKELFKVNINNYQVLLILSDGNIHDLQKTIDLIVEGSFLPLSIIIVGVGSNDFVDFIILDDDDIPLINSKGEQSFRKNLKFVPFSNFKNDENFISDNILNELPKHVINYFSNKFIKPEDLLMEIDLKVKKTEINDEILKKNN